MNEQLNLFNDCKYLDSEQVVKEIIIEVIKEIDLELFDNCLVDWEREEIIRTIERSKRIKELIKTIDKAINQ